MKLRVSFIDFLNSVPLGWSFLHGELRDVFDLGCDVPSRCARRLAEGDADVGLIPVIEYLRNPSLSILPGISISSKREVRSVLFVSKLPLPEVRRVALDTSSRTSAALLQILLKRFYRLDGISYEPCPPDPDRMLEAHDAALIIGNPALKVLGKPLIIYDLAAEWGRFTGLPFVFAVWAVRNGVVLGDQARHFYDSRREGLRNVDRIARMYSECLGLSPSEIRTYLLHHLDYSLDEANLKGMRAFFELAVEEGLAPGGRDLDFVPVESETAQEPENASQARP